MKKVILSLVFVIGLIGSAFAQTAVLDLNNAVLDKFVLSPGLAYSPKTKNLVNTETVKVWQFNKPSTNKYLNILSELDLSIDTGFGTPNRYVLGGSVSLFKFAQYGMGNVPILKYIEVRPQVLYSISFINPSNLTNAKKEWIYGFTIMSLKF